MLEGWWHMVPRSLFSVFPKTNMSPSGGATLLSSQNEKEVSFGEAWPSTDVQWEDNANLCCHAPPWFRHTSYPNSLLPKAVQGEEKVPACRRSKRFWSLHDSVSMGLPVLRMGKHFRKRGKVDVWEENKGRIEMVSVWTKRPVLFPCVPERGCYKLWRELESEKMAILGLTFYLEVRTLTGNDRMARVRQIRS